MKVKDSEGFTLIEVMIAFACMALAFVSLWALHVSSIKVSAANNLEARGLALVRERIEAFRSMPFSSLPSDGSDPNINTTQTPPFEQLSWDIERNPFWRSTVTVTVTWKDKIRSFSGVVTYPQRSVQMTSIITDLQ